MTVTRRDVWAGLALACGRALALTIAMAGFGQALAADFPIPNKPIRVIVGFPPGGGTDLQARQLAQQLSQVLGGVTVIVENRPGAGTMLAAVEVSRAAPDGHTLLYTPASTLAQLPQTLAAVKYDTFKDFTPIAQAALGPLVLVLHNAIPATTVRELVAYARSRPGELNYVSQGIGTPAHIFGQVFAKQAGIDIGEKAPNIYDPQIQIRLLNDIREGIKLGITGTPAYVIDGQIYLGQIPPEILDKITGK